MPAETFQKATSNIYAMYRLSLSATPKRTDGADLLLWSQTGTIICRVSVELLVKKGYLAKPRFVILDYGVKYSGERYPDEYKAMWQSHKRSQAIVEYAAQAHRNGHKVYIDVKRIEHGKRIVKLLHEQGIDAKFISGSSSTEIRQAALKEFEDDGFILVSTLIKEGVDLPAMSMVIMAGGGKSEINTIQTIGRALRPKAPINEAFVVDLHDRGYYVGEHASQRQDTMKNYYNGLYVPEIIKTNQVGAEA